MPWREVRDPVKGRIRFWFDEDEGLIRHQSRGGEPQIYRIEREEDRRYALKEVQPRRGPRIG